MNAMRYAAAMLAVCGLGAPVLAQYALDKNLQVGSGGRNGPGRDFKRELEFRNAIVTGNAPGGMSFRGDVGYRAPGEFFGSLGSNETFAFRRDSAFSGLAGLGIRGTEALQYQFAVTTGNSPPPGLTGVPVYTRSGAGGVGVSGGGGATIGGVGQGGLTELSLPKPEQTGSEDLRGLALMSVRSPSAYVANRGLRPSFLGQTADKAGGAQVVTASVLRGVAFDDMGLVRPKKEPETKPGPLAAPETTVTTAAPAVTPTTQVRTEYDELVDRFKRAVPAAEGTGASPQPEWQRRLAEVRKELAEARVKSEAKAAAAARTAEEGEAKPGQPGAPSATGEPAKDERGPAREDGTRGPKPRERFSPDTVGVLRSAAAKITVLAPASLDMYGTQMKAGQDHLGAGRYFDAEERFTAALSVRAGDPMAAVGRVHAQMGAGMFLSAAINLRVLLVEHPELAGVKYSAGLLPGKERIEGLMSRLEELSSQGEGRGRDPSLLLAYMGHQTGNAEAQKRGLERMAAGGGGGEDADQLARLAALLGQVWADGGGDAGEKK